MARFVKLTARPNTWFKEGTEVFDYNSNYEDKVRVTVDEWESCKKDSAVMSGICVRGIRVDENGEEYIDGEFCALDEFDVEYL